MFVAGIDFSSLAIDVVLVDLDDLAPPEWQRYRLMGADAFERTRNVAAAIPGPDASFYEDIIAIGIEHPAGKFGTGPMMRVQGAVLACLPAGVLVQPWPPASWRKAVGLAGNASKDAVAIWAADHSGRPYSFSITPRISDIATGTEIADDRRYSGWPQDAWDAYCIALATRDAITVQPLPEGDTA